MEEIGPMDGRENIDTVFTEVDFEKNVVGFVNGVTPEPRCDFPVSFCLVFNHLYSASLNVAPTGREFASQRLTRYTLV